MARTTLFLRCDLVVDFVGDRRIMRVVWGEREVTAEWSSVPPGFVWCTRPTSTFGATSECSISPSLSPDGDSVTVRLRL